MRKPSTIPVAFSALYLIAAFIAGPIIDQGSWVRIGWVIAFTLAVVSAGVLWAVYGIWRRTALLIAVGILGPVTITVSIGEGLTLVREAHDRRTKRQLEHSRISDLRDEPLPGPKGNAVGVRIRYRVEYDQGLDDDHFAPFATVHVDIPAANLSVAGRQVTPQVGGAYPKGSYEITEDFLPNFTPFLFRESPELCFQWPGEKWKAGVLASEPQHYQIVLQPYRLTSRTSRTYSYRDFYEGALKEGVQECGR
jgi:hypothetical protein